VVSARQGRTVKIKALEEVKEMERKPKFRFAVVAVLVVVTCTCEAGFGAPVYIPGVPDWDQPVLARAQTYKGMWGAWCTPTATANIVGYYNDNGVAGIGDNQVFPATPAWRDPHWQDDTAEGLDILSLFFYGTVGNAVSADDKMWVELKDAGAVAGVAIYDGPAGDVAVAAWHEWKIDLGVFAAAGVNLTNVDSVHIGFGGPQGGQAAKGGVGTVWFDDVIVSGLDVVDDFDSYASQAALWNVWDDYWVNVTGAEVFVEVTPPFTHGGNSIRYFYDNTNKTLIGSRIDADISGLAIGPNWRAGPGGVARLDLGWYLNTNDLGLGGTPGAPGHRGTKREHILNGATGNGGLIGGGRGYFPSSGVAGVCVAVYGGHRMDANEYANTDTTGEPNKVYHTDQAALIQIMVSIDSNQPLLAHFDHFNLQPKTRAFDPNFGVDPNYDHTEWGTAPVYGPNGYTDPCSGEVWDPNQGLGHTVTVVGYWPGADAGNPLAVDAIIVHDNGDGTLAGPTALPLVLPWAGSPWKALTLIKGVASPSYDLSGDCFVNFLDLRELAAHWLE
jgi:hypothetical protein